LYLSPCFLFSIDLCCISVVTLTHNHSPNFITIFLLNNN
jgi:hypothetical protein